MKRMFCFFDEWLSYAMLLYIYTYGSIIELFSVGTVAILAIVTAYKNLSMLEEQMGICKKQHFFYPLC